MSISCFAHADGFLHLDANNMMAGQTLMFELELVSIDPQQTRKQL